MRGAALAALGLTVVGLGACGGAGGSGAGDAPRLGAAAIERARTEGDGTALTLQVNTAFASSHDDDADAQHQFTRLTVRLRGGRATARRTASDTDLRGDAADGSASAQSVWTDTWTATLPARATGRLTGRYLVVVTGCHADGGGCERSVVPVCLRRGSLAGEPTNSGMPNAARFGRSPTWSTDFSCRRPSLGTVDAASEPRPPVAAQPLPADLDDPV